MNWPKLAMRVVLGRRLPITSGRVSVSGITGRVTIRRDGYGIPHIEAASDADAWFGLGFCQGQDRTFQLETILRAVRGTVAALIGADGLDVDRLSRRLGFRRVGEQALGRLDPEHRAAAEAFAAGVTAGGTVGLRRRPHEFVLLRARPTPYTAADVAGVIALQSFGIAANWDMELARLQVLASDGPDALAAIDPVAPAHLPVTAPPGTAAGPAADRLAEDLARFRAHVGTTGGSNNWAVAPGRTATGRPILANDPHLAPVLPPQWYLCHVAAPDWQVAGASLVGAPGIPSGHNGHAAWGVTAGLVDNTDLFIEDVGPDGRSVREGDRFVPCEVRTEVIEVRGGAPVTEEVLVTRRGPIIGPALAGDVGAVSVAATWLQPGRIEGVLGLHRVRTFAEFREAFRDWPALSMNLAYADAGGTIGWQLAGEAPVRRSGTGLVPQPGWAPDAGWEDERVPFDAMPHAADPDTGWIATANNRPAVEGEGPYLGADFLDGYRVARIGERLAERDDWDIAGTMALQTDQLSLPWREVRAAVLNALDRPTAAQPAKLLRDWDGVLAADSPAAALWSLLLLELDRRIVERHAPEATTWALGAGFTPLVPHTLYALRRTGHLARLIVEQPPGVLAGAWPDEIADALAAVHGRLRERFGNDPAGWAWGRARPLTLRHPLSARPPLDRVFNLGPFPIGGDANTVAQASPDPVAPLEGLTVAIASLRLAVDVGDWDASRYVLPSGQSGNPFSPHYADLLPLWQRGEGVSIPIGAPAVAAATVDTLDLVT